MSVMDTPEARYGHAGYPLYGERGDSINRRALIGALAAFALVPPALAATPRITKLWWRGRAHVEVGGRSLDLVVETTLGMPLLNVRSTSYILSEGPAAARTMILEKGGSWVEKAGQRTPLSTEVGIHERQQYAIYAWLLALLQSDQRKPGRLQLSAPPWPDIIFTVGDDGYPLAAELTVDADEAGKPPIPERMEFSGRIDSNGLSWPRRFVLTQAGKPYFTLDIEEFKAG